MRNSLKWFAGLSLAVLLTPACRDEALPQGAAIMPDTASAQIPSEWSEGHVGGAPVPGWITSFRDPELTALVEDAVRRNPDLAAAAARVEASQAAVRVAAGALYPRLGLKAMGEVQGSELSGDLGLGIDPPTLGNLGVESSGGNADSRTVESSSQRGVYGIGLGASWELDVWGRIRSKKAAAKADSEALQADYEFARQSLAATVARAYFSAIEAAQQEKNAQDTLTLYKRYGDLVKKKEQQGFASNFDISQIDSRTAGAEDAYLAAQAARAEAIRAVEVFTSRYPAGKAPIPTSFPSQPGKVPSGLPAELLERRPDLIAAERRFAAAFHRVREAKTARLPRFGLSGSTGLATADLIDVGAVDSLSWSLAGGIVQPIFLGGELKAQQDIRTAEQRAAVADYVSAALGAFKDVEDALAAEHYLRQREEVLARMVTASQRASDLSLEQYDQGQVDMFSILRLAGENLAAKLAHTQIQAARLRERVDLHLALGGSFKGHQPAIPDK